MKSRAEALRRIEGQSFDVCVIGGGATGSGCALDAQLRGLKTVQLEAADFGSATSSTSTKLVHGGVRYLEQAVRQLDPYEYRVVDLALQERIHMLENAPFLTQTREFITPCYNWFDVAYFEVGLKLYDWIAGPASLSRSYFLSRAQVLRRLPALQPNRLVGGVVYSDGQFDDARYNIALVQTFTGAGGAALNYARATAFEKNQIGRIAAVEVEDQFTHRRFAIHARAFVNATGPFADMVREMATPGIPHRMRLSKGVHILLPLEVFSTSDALLIPRTEDGRVLFAVPWMGRLLVGTTEQDVAVQDELHLTKDEVDYLLRHLNPYLAHPVAPEAIVSGMAGARPLVRSGNPKDTKKLARDHVVELDPSTGLISILGGKWTTHRAMAEDTINAAQKYLGDSVTASLTRRHALAGSDGYAPNYWQSLVKDFGVTERAARHLAGKFGTRAAKVMQLARDNPGLAAPLVEGLAPVRAEVVFCARDEMAMSIEDILARRIGLQFYGWREAIQTAPVVAGLLARELGWSSTVEHQALDQYVGKIQAWMQKAGLTMRAPRAS